MAKKTETPLEPRLWVANPDGWLHGARHIGASKGGFLVGSEGTYRAAVGAVALVLRARFEAGELRGWQDGDADQEDPPLLRVEAECRRLFVTSPTAAFVVLTFASGPALRAAGWENVMGTDGETPGAALDLVASVAMAHDVVAHARRRGWLRAARREVAA